MEMVSGVSRTAGISFQRNVPGAGDQQIHQKTGDNMQFSASPARKDLINALNLMQTASGIIQEALNASSELRSMAMSSIFTGHTDYNEVADSLAGIQASLHQYGQMVTIPQINESNEKQPIPDISHEMALMGNMTKDKVVSQTELSTIDKNLTDKGKEINDRMSLLEKQLGLSKPNYPEESVMVRESSLSIMQHSGGAMIAQGNLRPETVRALL